ncbi:MAG: sulfite exporter TauE/SafE family protein [Acetobacteraceae bacterium]|nr:sulfite exporter TauE/SafE family protein [Acetobacteraceae bacterium]
MKSAESTAFLSPIYMARLQRGEAVKAQLVCLLGAAWGAGTRLAPLRRVTVASGRPIANSALWVAGGGLLLLCYALALQQAGAAAFSPTVLMAVFIASTASSIAGFAFSAICGALLVHLMHSPVHMVELMIVCSIAIQSLSVWSLRRSLDWQALPPFLMGGLISMPFGVYLLLHTQQKSFGTLMGAFLIAYGGFMLFRKPMQLRRNYGRIGDGMAGLLGGITGGLAGFPGALVTIWCGLKGWDKKQQRAIYQPFILIMQVMTLVAIHFMRGGSTMDTNALAAWAYVPGAMFGTWCGLMLFGRLSDRQFGIAVNLLLVTSGAGLFVS